MNNITIAQTPIQLTVETETSFITVETETNDIALEIETSVIEISPSDAVDVLIDAIGIQGAKGDQGDAGDGSFKAVALQGYLTPFPITNYSGKNIAQIELYTDSSLVTLLLSTDFTYEGGRLTQVKYSNGRTGATLTKPFSYDVNGNILPGQGVLG